MGYRDLKSSISIQQSLTPAARTATANGTGVDTRGYDSVVAEVSRGLADDADFTFKLQDSPDNSAWTDVAAANLDGSFTDLDGVSSPETGENGIDRVGYKGTQRYVRVVATEAGTSPAPSNGNVFGANIILGHAHQRPVA